MAIPITYDELREHIGILLFGARTVSAIEADSNFSSHVERSLVSGLRTFYRPHKVAEGQPHHVWSFLYRDTVLTTVASQQTKDLPEDFSGLGAGFTFDAGTTYLPPILVSEEMVRRLTSQSSTTGRPEYYAVRARSAPQDRSRYEALFFPIPDAAYALTARYAFEPSILSDDNPYPLGGGLHAETILESCLAAAEKILNPESGEGLHAQRFKELVMASLEMDMGLLPAGVGDLAYG